MKLEYEIVDWATRENAYPDWGTWKDYFCGFEAAGPGGGETHANLTLEEFIDSIKMYADNLSDGALSRKIDLIEKYGKDGYRSIRNLAKIYKMYDPIKLSQAATEFWNEVNKEEEQVD